jgi:hypothetical protein
VAYGILGVIGLALFLGLNAGADPAGSTATPGADSGSRAYYDLLPHWYPALNAILGVTAVALVIAVIVMLMRSSVADFYRPASGEQDPRWSAFVADQQKRIAGDDLGRASGITRAESGLSGTVNVVRCAGYKPSGCADSQS